mmetsp:Transcript_42946/g.108419  ORF Transcript_42946/g.108419 Transcript_42946/m.108419 type:complete len:200 (+) Transcript_42946:398-997(+)
MWYESFLVCAPSRNCPLQRSLDCTGVWPTASSRTPTLRCSRRNSVQVTLTRRSWISVPPYAPLRIRHVLVVRSLRIVMPTSLPSVRQHQHQHRNQHQHLLLRVHHHHHHHQNHHLVQVRRRHHLLRRPRVLLLHLLHFPMLSHAIRSRRQRNNPDLKPPTYVLCSGLRTTSTSSSGDHPPVCWPLSGSSPLWCFPLMWQ